MAISQEIKNRVDAKVRELIAKVVAVNPRAIVPDSFPVTYRKDMKTIAGLAYMREFRIELNEQLFLANTNDFFQSTIPHEVCHLLTRIIFPYAKQAHGPEWKSVMLFLGYNPSRCHSYDVSVSVTGKRYRYVCNCKERTPFMITKLIHSRMVTGQVRCCKTCKGKLVYWPTEE